MAGAPFDPGCCSSGCGCPNRIEPGVRSTGTIQRSELGSSGQNASHFPSGAKEFGPAFVADTGHVLDLPAAIRSCPRQAVTGSECDELAIRCPCGKQIRSRIRGQPGPGLAAEVMNPEILSPLPDNRYRQPASVGRQVSESQYLPGFGNIRSARPEGYSQHSANSASACHPGRPACRNQTGRTAPNRNSRLRDTPETRGTGRPVNSSRPWSIGAAKTVSPAGRKSDIRLPR